MNRYKVLLCWGVGILLAVVLLLLTLTKFTGEEERESVPSGQIQNMAQEQMPTAETDELSEQMPTAEADEPPEQDPFDIRNPLPLEEYAQTLVDSDATVTPVPMGEAAKVDLDGDGQEELVQVRALSEDASGMLCMAQTENSDTELPVIQVNDRVFTPECLYDMGVRDECPDIGTYYILDIDLHDGYKEIAVYFDGPSGDPDTYLFHYQDGSLSEVGDFEAPMTEEMKDRVYWAALAPFQKPRVCSPQKYEEALAAVNRDSIFPVISGDGTVYAEGRRDILMTNWAMRVWRLETDKEHPLGMLAEVIPEEYFFTVRQPAIARREIPLYSEADTQSESLSIREGEEVCFYSYRPDQTGSGRSAFLDIYSEDIGWDDGGWMCIAYGNLESLDEVSHSEELHFGWLRIEDGCIECPLGSYHVFELFDNLVSVD